MSTNQVIVAANYPEFNLGSTTANQTYIVTTNKNITGTINLAANVTLIFAGGRLTGSGTLNADETKLIAPITQIFDRTLNLTGSWIMDRAYPQWFGVVSNITSQEGTIANTDLDAAPAINKAIQLKGVGEVFLPKGNYLIATTIWMKHGIMLQGEKCSTSGTSTTPSVDQGTTIWAATNHNFAGTATDGRFLIAINLKKNHNLTTNIGDEGLEVEWGSKVTKVSGIFFYNNISSLSNLRCIFTGAPTDVENCYFFNLAQAVVYHGHYIDNKKVTDCVFGNYMGITPLKKYYAFAFGQGDAFCFERNSVIANENSMEGAFSIGLANGAKIANNILNADILIKNSKAVDFSSNHMEGKETQLAIVESIVSVSDNFFEKGAVPSLRIEATVTKDSNGKYGRGTEGSVVSLNNNFFGYYENDHEEIKNSSGVVTGYIYKNISDLDVIIDSRSSLKINDSYRYWVTRGTIGQTKPFGLALGNIEISEAGIETIAKINDFNRHSYFLSTESNVRPFYTLPKNNSIILSANLSSYYFALNGGIKWQIASGTYTYRAQIIWDADRAITGNNILALGSLSPIKNGSGVMASLSGLSACGFNCIIRLERKIGTTTMICDVPLCGNRHIYDNGNSVCGYKWVAGSLITNGFKPTGSIEFKGDKIVCYHTSAPATGVGTWKDGDKVYNLSSVGGSNALWMCVNGNWYAK